MASLSLIPIQGSDPKAALAALGKNFDLAPEIVDALVKAKINNFEEFRFLFSDGAQVEAFVQKVKMEDHLIQTARLRRAWAAMNLYFTQADQDRSKAVTSDLDSLLDESELRDSKQSF